MDPDSQKIYNLDGNQSNGNMNSSQKKSGVYISRSKAFSLVLLAVFIVVGVIIVIHFADGNRNIVCQCDKLGAEGASSAMQEIMKLTQNGSKNMCDLCPSPKSAADQHPSASSTTTSPTTPSKPTNVRLPDTVYPIHYDVELQPYMHHSDPAQFTFRGHVKILAKCLKPADNITLHVNVLNISTSSIKFYPEEPQGSEEPQYLNWEVDTERQFFVIKLTKNMKVNKNYFVEMSFTSPLTNNLNGLYYSQYNRGNKTVYLAATQFQATDARKAFPCFDEPAIKATFNITLVRPRDRTSLSNMPIIDSSERFTEDGITYVKDVYAKTPKMPTYLLAFVISDFAHNFKSTKYNVLYRAFSTPETVNQTLYSLGVGVSILTFFEDYFSIKYPLPKQDMVAVPDFAAGAMENWGLILYRETAMLYEPGVSNEFNKERVAIVVSHELAHQWFGNLVTPSWWDDLWLNEGFASFVEYLGVDHVHPDWEMFDKFVVYDVHKSLSSDGLVSSHPVYVPVSHPDEISEIFDTISYAKGASIIRMMRHFLGFDTFKKGLTMYLGRRAYDAAFHDDLWQALTEQAQEDGKDLDVKAIMDTWTLQMNYPVVTVMQDPFSRGAIDVKQERYLSDPKSPDPGKYESPFDYHWTIPLTFTSSENPNFEKTDVDVVWMDKSESTKTIEVDDLPDQGEVDGWILANINQNGYYRVNYDIGNWAALSNQLQANHLRIPVTNRAQIINDAWNLAKGGYVTLKVALTTVEYLDKERDYVPWYAARAELSFVNRMLAFHSLYGSFQRFMKDKLKSAYRHFGLDNSRAGHVESQTRQLIAGEACKYGIQECLDAASAQYRKWMTNPSVNPIDPNLKSVVYCNAIANGGWEEWSFGLKMYKAINVASEKASMLSVLACSREPWILQHFMDLLLKKNSPIRKQDATLVISYVSFNTVGRSVAWNFFRGNYELLRKEFGDSSFSWQGIIRSVTSGFNTAFELQEVENFKKSQIGNLGSGERAYDQALETISSNMKWMQANIPAIAAWLSEAGYVTE